MPKSHTLRKLKELPNWLRVAAKDSKLSREDLARALGYAGHGSLSKQLMKGEVPELVALREMEEVVGSKIHYPVVKVRNLIRGLIRENQAYEHRARLRAEHEESTHA